MRIFCPRDAAIWVDDPLLHMVDPMHVQAALLKYWQDGGQPPGDFKVAENPGSRGPTIYTRLSDGRAWGVELPQATRPPPPWPRSRRQR